MTFTLPSRYRGWWLAAVAGVVLALCAAAWLALRAPLADVVVVRATPLVRTLQFSARVATLSRVDVGATITGRVAKVRVTEGAQVRQGDVLLELEGDELRAALAQAVAAERQAQARLAGLRGSGRQAARAISEATGGQVVVENRTGAGGTISSISAQLPRSRWP